MIAKDRATKRRTFGGITPPVAAEVSPNDDRPAMSPLAIATTAVRESPRTDTR